MKQFLTGALIATVTALLVAPALAHESESSNRPVYIERQCIQYENFCKNETHKTKKHVRHAKKPIRRTVGTNDRYEKKPFIERQCTRYGFFC